MTNDITVAIRLPYENPPREITVEPKYYVASEYGVTLTHAGREVFYPWHRVDWVSREVASE